MRDGRAVLAVVRRDGAAIIGRLEYETGHSSEGWLTVTDIEMSPALRGFGFGSEAIRLIEDEALASETASRFRAVVAPDNGLGLYFWLRLGYRPAGRDEMPVGDSFWMVRPRV